MPSALIRRALSAALLAAAGCLALGCDLVEARGGDSAAAPALTVRPAGRRAPRRRAGHS